MTRFQSLPEPMDPAFAHYAESARTMTRSPLPPAPSLPQGEALLTRVMQDSGFELKPRETPILQRPGVRIGGVLGVVGVATTVADATQMKQRYDTLLAQDNLLGAKNEVRDFVANNTNAWVAGYTVGKLGAELGGRRGVQGAIAGGIAGGILGYTMSDKAMEGLDWREITSQVDAQGRQWQFNGNQWVRPMEADLSGSGTGQVQEQNFSADLDTRRLLDYQASGKSVEIAMSRLAPPRNPYSLEAGDQDGGSLRPANWTRDSATGQWHRDRVTDIDANGRYIHDYQTALPQRAVELDRQAAAVIEANIANGPAPIAARYNVAHHLQGWEGPKPAAVSAALVAGSLQASNGHQYQLGADGRWRSGDDVATGNLAVELTATREALQPKLESHTRTMAQLPPWQRPTQAQEDLASLATTYHGFGIAPNPESLAAIQIAINTTREQHGLNPAMTSLALDPEAQGKRDINSPIMHLHRDSDGAIRVAAVTTAQEIELARQELRAQGFSLDTPIPNTPEQKIEAQTPQQREAYTQALREANREGVAAPEAARIATMAAVQARAPGHEHPQSPAEPEVRPEREPVAAEQSAPAAAPMPTPPVVETRTQDQDALTRPQAKEPEQAGLRQGDRGPDVEFLQTRLQRVGATGPEGQPVPLDGKYGMETEHAVRQIQQSQGLPATGVADQALDDALARMPAVQRASVARTELEPSLQAAREQTVVERPSQEQHTHETQATSGAPRPEATTPEQAQTVDDRQPGQTREQRIDVPESSRAQGGPSLAGGGRPSDRDEQQEPTPHQAQGQSFPTNHPDYALFTAIRSRLPAGTPDEKTAEILLETKRGDILRPDQFSRVVMMDNDRVLVFGKTACFYSNEVSLGAPAPALNETLQRSQDLDRQNALQAQQFQEQQARINQNQGGPTMSM